MQRLSSWYKEYIVPIKVIIVQQIIYLLYFTYRPNKVFLWVTITWLLFSISCYCDSTILTILTIGVNNISNNNNKTRKK